MYSSIGGRGLSCIFSGGGRCNGCLPCQLVPQPGQLFRCYRSGGFLLSDVFQLLVLADGGAQAQPIIQVHIQAGGGILPTALADGLHALMDALHGGFQFHADGIYTVGFV